MTAGGVLADKSGGQRATARPPRLVIFDRDGTLVENVPYNGDPEKVVPLAGARDLLDRLRATGVSLAVVSNQSGVSRGLLTLDQVHEVNARIESLLGPLGSWFICPHAPDDGCSCRKPNPGLIVEAAAAAGVATNDCVVVGDQPSDLAAGRAAGTGGILLAPAGPGGDAPRDFAVARDLGEVGEILFGAGGT